MSASSFCTSTPSMSVLLLDVEFSCFSLALFAAVNQALLIHLLNRRMKEEDYTGLTESVSKRLEGKQSFYSGKLLK